MRRIMWQDMVEPSPHNGGWAIAMLAERLMLMHEDAVSHDEAENAFDMLRSMHAKHGEVPSAFRRAWILSQGENARFLARSDPGNLYIAAKYEATRQMWRNLRSPQEKGE